jgi:ABC-type sugar transport system substrate-binding protein
MRQLLKMSKPPHAVLIANNLMTLGALQAIHEQGLQIPEEMAVLGFDDMPWASSLRPPLSAVAQPAEEIGRTAAQLLLERLNDPGRIVRQVILPATLVVRASCGAHLPGFNEGANPKNSERPARSASARNDDLKPFQKDQNIFINPNTPGLPCLSRDERNEAKHSPQQSWKAE